MVSTRPSRLYESIKGIRIWYKIVHSRYLELKNYIFILTLFLSNVYRKITIVLNLVRDDAFCIVILIYSKN